MLIIIIIIISNGRPVRPLGQTEAAPRPHIGPIVLSPEKPTLLVSGVKILKIPSYFQEVGELGKLEGVHKIL